MFSINSCRAKGPCYRGLEHRLSGNSIWDLPPEVSTCSTYHVVYQPFLTAQALSKTLDCHLKICSLSKFFPHSYPTGRTSDIVYHTHGALGLGVGGGVAGGWGWRVEGGLGAMSLSTHDQCKPTQ